MKWSDTYRTVYLPVKPVQKLHLVFDEFYTSGGVQVSVRHIDSAYGETLGIKQGDVCTSINGVRPKGEAHALSLLDRQPSQDADGHKCVFRTYGFHRWGKPLIIVGGMVISTIAMIFYELQLLEDNDAREL
mmetsp:Transcript_32179/g.80148  ORF Transcript_32179/g.80148 Transcript_32179/m.80148 type:complete len:131 (+) Transcript_32179:40-432(+)